MTDAEASTPPARDEVEPLPPLPPLPNGAPVVYGHGVIERLPEVVSDAGARRVLLVRGQRSFEASGAVRVLPELERVAEVAQWSEFSPNTDADDLRRGLALVDETGPDLVVAVGGGSTIDMAKLLCAFEDLEELGRLDDAIRSGTPVDRRRHGLVLAPTTSGSGSEATHFAVVYIGENKFSVAGPGLRPDTVILDPALSTSGSAYQRATSGIDAVCQAIESLWATGATPESRRFADAALTHLLPAIEGFVDEPSPEKAAGMARGSHLAGRAIDISKTTAAHALSYAITKRYGVSHGHAVALTLAAFLRAHDDVGPEALQPAVDPTGHRAAMERILGHLGAADGAKAAEAFGDLMRRIGLDTRLTEVGVETAPQRAALAEAVNLERLGNNPVAFSTDGLVRLLESAA